MTTTVVNTGWAHSAGSRTGHYLDCGDPVCGDDPRTMYGDMDLRTDQPTGACPACAQTVKRAGGAPRHRHKWIDASTLAGEQYICRCGDQTTSL
jgi:hypothetical protein